MNMCWIQVRHLNPSYHVYTEGVLESPLVAGCAEQQLMSKSPTPWRPEPTLQAATTWEVSDGDRGFVSDIYVRLGTYLCPMSCHMKLIH